MNTINQQAEDNLSALKANPYPGRGIVAGLSQDGKSLVQVYWIMGRSENSRNRVFSRDGDRVYTEAADPGKVVDPSLIIYNAMRRARHHYFVVSNGDQTDTVVDEIALSRRSISLDDCLRSRQYEPDQPNYTQRITALSRIDAPLCTVELSILRKSPFGPQCEPVLYRRDLAHAGIGFYISTYAGDGDPLPPFTGDPLVMPFVGSMEEVAADYYEALNEENRVSLAVNFINIETCQSTIHIINKYKKVT